MHSDLASAVLAADELWSAFQAWLEILDGTAGKLRAGHIVRLDCERARWTATEAAEVSPWRDELTTYFAAFDRANGSVAVWFEVGERPRGTSGAYMEMHLREARSGLERLARFLFAQLRELACQI